MALGWGLLRKPAAFGNLKVEVEIEIGGLKFKWGKGFGVGTWAGVWRFVGLNGVPERRKAVKVFGWGNRLV